MDPKRDYADAAMDAWSRIAPEVDLQAYSIMLRLVRAGRLIEASLGRLADDQGLGVRGDYEVLAALRRSHPDALRPQDLADRVMISAPGMTGRLDRLEKAGLVNRTPHPTDRRSTLIEITPDGLALADRFFRSVVNEADRLFDAVTAARRRRITQELRDLLATLGDIP